MDEETINSMIHFHLVVESHQRGNASAITDRFVDRHMTCVENTRYELAGCLSILGYQISSHVVTPFGDHMVIEHTGSGHRLHMAIQACTCPEGEADWLAQQIAWANAQESERRHIASQN